MAEKPQNNDSLNNGSSSEQEGYQQMDRPLECSECRRSIAVHYTEICNNALTHTVMCNECPILRHKLHGIPHVERIAGQAEITAGLACGNCGTTLESIRMGSLLGCEMCYEVFEDVLLSEMQAAEKLPARVNINKKSVPIHMGRSPGEMQEISPAVRLLALNEALKEMLKSEDYEQAAWLRDQINALTEKPEKENK